MRSYERSDNFDLVNRDKNCMLGECGWIWFDPLLSLTLRLKDSNVDFNELIALYHNVNLQYVFWVVFAIL